MRIFLAEFLFLIHLLFIIFWLGLFLIPSSFWPERIAFHFYFTLAIVFHQLLWGLIILPWTKKYQLACFFTTFTQLLRGEKISAEIGNNFFTKEFLAKFGIPFSHRAALILTLSILILSAIQYLKS